MLCKIMYGYQIVITQKILNLISNLFLENAKFIKIIVKLLWFINDLIVFFTTNRIYSKTS